jgi:hypothetical protein
MFSFPTLAILTRVPLNGTGVLSGRGGSGKKLLSYKVNEIKTSGAIIHILVPVCVIVVWDRFTLHLLQEFNTCISDSLEVVMLVMIVVVVLVVRWWWWWWGC